MCKRINTKKRNTKRYTEKGRYFRDRKIQAAIIKAIAIILVPFISWFLNSHSNRQGVTYQQNILIVIESEAKEDKTSNNLNSISMSSRSSPPDDFDLELIMTEDLVEHNFDVVWGVPVAMVIEWAGLFEDAVKLDAAGTHKVDICLGGGVAVIEGAFFLCLTPEDLIVAIGIKRRVDINEVNAGDVLTMELTGILFSPAGFETPIEGTDCIVIVGGHKPYDKADFNKDGKVDYCDFAEFAQSWLQSSIVED